MNDRDCNRCAHHKENGCESWECEPDYKRCENCEHFKRLYVPPLPMYGDVPRGYLCAALTNEDSIMWLGDDARQAKNGFCEMFTEADQGLEVNLDEVSF